MKAILEFGTARFLIEGDSFRSLCRSATQSVSPQAPIDEGTICFQCDFSAYEAQCRQDLEQLRAAGENVEPFLSTASAKSNVPMFIFSDETFTTVTGRVRQFDSEAERRAALLKSRGLTRRDASHYDDVQGGHAVAVPLPIVLLDTYMTAKTAKSLPAELPEKNKRDLENMSYAEYLKELYGPSGVPSAAREEQAAAAAAPAASTEAARYYQQQRAYPTEEPAHAQRAAPEPQSQSQQEHTPHRAPYAAAHAVDDSYQTPRGAAAVNGTGDTLTDRERRMISDLLGKDDTSPFAERSVSPYKLAQARGMRLDDGQDEPGRERIARHANGGNSAHQSFNNTGTELSGSRGVNRSIPAAADSTASRSRGAAPKPYTGYTAGNASNSAAPAYGTNAGSRTASPYGTQSAAPGNNRSVSAYGSAAGVGNNNNTSVNASRSVSQYGGNFSSSAGGVAEHLCAVDDMKPFAQRKLSPERCHRGGRDEDLGGHRHLVRRASRSPERLGGSLLPNINAPSGSVNTSGVASRSLLFGGTSNSAAPAYGTNAGSRTASPYGTQSAAPGNNRSVSAYGGITAASYSGDNKVSSYSATSERPTAASRSLFGATNTANNSRANGRSVSGYGTTTTTGVAPASRFSSSAPTTAAAGGAAGYAYANRNGNNNNNNNNNASNSRSVFAYRTASGGSAGSRSASGFGALNPGASSVSRTVSASTGGVAEHLCAVDDMKPFTQRKLSPERCHRGGRDEDLGGHKHLVRRAGAEGEPLPVLATTGTAAARSLNFAARPASREAAAERKPYNNYMTGSTGGQSYFPM